MRRFDPEGRGSCGDIGGAAFKAAIRAFAITYAAPVVAKDRITRSGKMRRQSCLSGICSAADFVATADDQQAGALVTLVERCGAPDACAIEAG